MTKTKLTTFDAPHAPHSPRPDYQDSQKCSEPPSGSLDLIHIDQRPAPRRSYSLLHDLADVSQATASSSLSLVAQEVREPSNLAGKSTSPHFQSEETRLGSPPYEQRLHAYKDACAANTRNHVAAPHANAGHSCPICAVRRTAAKPVLDRSQGRLGNRHLCRVKVLICGDSNDSFSAADTEFFKATCLKCVDGLRLDNVRVYSDHGPIWEEFDWFFDPNDIVPGGLLILCITGHGVRTEQGVELKLNQFGPTLMDTIELHNAINKIQVSCTLEIVLGTCNSEAVVCGLDKTLEMQNGHTVKEPQSMPSPLSTLLKSFFWNNLPPKLETKATVIVWAAAVDGGPAYPEADLPGREGKYDVMIGAICRAFEASTASISRRTLFGNICDAVVEYNTAREEKYRIKTQAEQYGARVAGKYRGAQLSCLLSSPGSQELILDRPAFKAL